MSRNKQKREIVKLALKLLALRIAAGDSIDVGGQIVRLRDIAESRKT